MMPQTPQPSEVLAEPGARSPEPGARQTTIEGPAVMPDVKRVNALGSV